MTDTIETSVEFDTVESLVEETMFDHYYAHQLEEKTMTGEYKVRNVDKGVQINVVGTPNGTEIGLKGAPNGLRNKIKNKVYYKENNYDKKLGGGSQTGVSVERSNDRGENKERDHSGERTNDFMYFDDGSIRFRPPFEKHEAGYKDSHENNTGKECRNCAHFIDGGGCHMVQGAIDETGTCDELYADVGVFADSDTSEVDISLVMWGEEYDRRFNLPLAEKLTEKLYERMKKRLK